MRDEFDPLHEYRAGWYQKPLSPSRREVVKALEEHEEPEIRVIVQEILDAFESEEKVDSVAKLLSVFTIPDDESSSNKRSSYILRGTTGKKAKNFSLNTTKKQVTLSMANLKILE